GVYNPTITDQLGCSVVHTVIIGSTSLHMVDSVTIDQPISCFGASDAIVTVHTSGGTPPYSYDWPFGGTDATQSGLSTGSYSFTVFDNTGCPTNGVVSILEPSELLATTVVATNVACFGEDDGQAQVLATGGTPPYTYQWDNGDTDQTSTNLNANLHVVTVTDNNLCTTTSTVTISEPTMLSLFIQNNNDPSCNAGSDGSATAFVGGGVPPYDYAWSHGETTQTATALANSIYSVTVTDANGCTATEETAINEPPILEISDFFIMEPLCFGGNDGSIDIDVAGGTPPFAFVWETQGITIATTEEITNIPTGTYSVTVTDDNGCATTASDNMNEPTELQVFVTNVQQNTCGNMDGAIDIAITGGTPPYFYNWSTGDTAQNLDGLGSGFYTVWVNDFNGCVAIADNILISDTDGPTIDLGADIQICIGDPVQMNPTISGVSGNETYFWFPPGLFDDPNIPNPVLTITQDTTVIFGINDGNCTVLDELFIEVYNISVSAQMTNPAGCPTGSDGVIEVIATGGVQPYSFSLDLTDWQASNIFSGLSPGTYVVYVTDAFGCLTQTLVDVTPGPDVPPLVIAIPPQFNSIYTCDDMLPQATVTLFLSGGLPFESQSNYLITVSGTTLGDDVVDDPFPGMVGGDVQYTFDVADGDNWIATVTDETGCSSDMILDLFEYSYDCLGCTDPFDVTADAGVDQLVCGNEAVQIGGFPAGTNTTGGETYAWTPTTGLNDATMPNPMASVSTTTVYTLVVTDQNGCIATDDVIVLHNPEMSIFDTSTTNPLCHDSVDGMIDFDQSGGTPPFSYIWTGPNGFTSESAPPLIALEQGASYCVTITDALGCDVSECFAISGPPQLNVSFSAKDDCGDSDGWAFAFVTGGIGTFTYNWSTGESTANINGLDSGIYDLTVTDENNCSLEASVQIFETDCVWAGDANYDGIANNDDVLALGIANGQTGPNRTFNFPEWIGVPADDWSGNFMDGVNYKHADCDGNGIVNQDDTLAISINYNMTHTVNFSPQGTPGAPPLTFEIEPDTVGPSTQVRIDIHYGEMTQQVNNLYGIALTVDYDADLVVPGSVYCDFSQSWIGDANETVWLSKELNGLVDIAISRTDQANVDGFGLIGTIYMVIEDNVDGFAPMDDVEMYLNFLDVNAISFDESEIPYSLTQGVLVIDPELTSTINPWLEEQVEVFPNPATENIHIEISNVNLESLQMFDILGREIQVVVDSRGQLSTIDITGIENGTYLVRVNTYEGSVSRRIVIAR
ncbi:MAG: T9SS type A sorting domain-containing protein, partial [Bacteroidota bacterium]